MLNIRKHVADVARSMNLRKVQMSQGKGLPMANQRCHWNAVQAVKNDMAVGVVEVIILDDDSCTVHYVSLLADGSLVDYTLGVMTLNSDYRFVRHVSPNEYDTINNSLMKLKQKLYSETPWHIRQAIKLSNEDWC